MRAMVLISNRFDKKLMLHVPLWVWGARALFSFLFPTCGLALWLSVVWMCSSILILNNRELETQMQIWSTQNLSAFFLFSNFWDFNQSNLQSIWVRCCACFAGTPNPHCARWRSVPNLGPQVNASPLDSNWYCPRWPHKCHPRTHMKT